MRDSAERSGDFFTREDLDHITWTDVIVVLEGHTTFLTGLDLWHFILEALQGLERAFVDHNVIALEAYTRRTACNTFGNQTTGNLAHACDLEDFLDIGIANEVFFDLVAEKARCRRFHIVHQIIDD